MLNITSANMTMRLQLVLIIAVLLLGVGYVAWFKWMNNYSLPMSSVKEKYSRKCVSVCMCVSVRMRVCLCIRMCVCALACVHMCVPQ